MSSQPDTPSTCAFIWSHHLHTPPPSTARRLTLPDSAAAIGALSNPDPSRDRRGGEGREERGERRGGQRKEEGGSEDRGERVERGVVIVSRY